MSLSSSDLADKISDSINSTLATSWSSVTQYYSGSVVFVGTNYYLAITTNMSQPPAISPTSWSQMLATDQVKTFAGAVIDTFQAGLVNNIPGTVMAMAPPVPGPITAGLASNGIMVLMSSIWISDMMAGFPGATGSYIANEASASTGYAMSSGMVSFASGDITGQSTATTVPLPTPGALVSGAGSGGLISGLSGDPWGSDVISSAFPNANSTLTKKIYKTIADYIVANAAVAYVTGSINGSFSAGGTPLIAGSGVGGMIS